MSTSEEKPAINKAAVDKETAGKILRSVQYDQGFHFSTGMFTGETAVSLFSFFEELRTIDLQSVKFHFQRRDFQNWIETTLGDKELAQRVDRIKSDLPDEEVRKQLLSVIEQRVAELQTASNTATKEPSPEPSGSKPAPEKGLKKFKLEELKNFDGQAGKPAYFAFNGKVYDATDSTFWLEGNHLGSHQAGKDLTADISSAPHGEEVFSKVKQVGILG